MACGILVPWLGIKPMSPALESGFLTTESPGKSPPLFLIKVTKSFLLLLFLYTFSRFSGFLFSADFQQFDYDRPCYVFLCLFNLAFIELTLWIFIKFGMFADFFCKLVCLPSPLLSGFLIIHIVDQLNHSLISEAPGHSSSCLVCFLSELHFVQRLLLCFQVHWSFFYTIKSAIHLIKCIFSLQGFFSSIQQSFLYPVSLCIKLAFSFTPLNIWNKFIMAVLMSFLLILSFLSLLGLLLLTDFSLNYGIFLPLCIAHNLKILTLGIVALPSQILLYSLKEYRTSLEKAV